MADSENFTTQSRFYGWKTYSVAAAAIVCGVIALVNGYWSDGLKGIIAGLALMTIRDAIGKLHEAIDINHRTLRDLRASIDSFYDKG
jgi:uncharacterized membrane protein YjjP (DUF1212 family)